MIVRNEAERLERCLASVAGFVDEMVLLDTGSSDATVAIAERCGAVVHRLAWPGDFAPARNAALELVRGDWVLVLDADEQLRPQARQPLRQLMAEPDLLLVNLLRFERGARQSPYSSVSRLFRRHAAIHWSGRYHAMVDDSVLALIQQEPHWRIADCPEPALVHDGYRPELLASGDKARRLRQAMERELEQRPGDPYACAKLGSLEVSEGRHERGIALLEQGLAHCAAAAAAVRYELLLHLAIARTPGEPLRAIALYRQALALPLAERISLGARLNLAGLLADLAGSCGEGNTAREQLAEAAQLAHKAAAVAPELGLAWARLAQVERRRGDLAAAIQAYQRAISLDPGQPEWHQNLGAAQLLAGDLDGARRGFREAIQLWRQQGQPAAAEDLRRRLGPLVKLDE
ncbi:glycosyltransferase [Cyanobium sp. ATX 6A2]|uniref:glycosyltransferase n=1 Tax=Cyanobium sp. ATX 6A2 TaxID=2823700 RepID=UPI0020CEBC9E|nr:glycosyltransferase [Cyanobium sp. ATX 6A2]MCP9889218.1 glycosyltransferase [Cyanobium sp. ATX 6A2]